MACVRHNVFCDPFVVFDVSSCVGKSGKHRLERCNISTLEGSRMCTSLQFAMMARIDVL